MQTMETAKNSDCQGWVDGIGWTSGAKVTLREVKLFYVMLQWCIHVFIHLLKRV